MGIREENGSILAIDVNTKSTKAVLFKKIDGKYGIAGTGEAPTTVEAPELDVTVGVLNAIAEIESKTGESLIQSGRPTPSIPLICSSSVSGGLHMVVAGLIKSISAESAQRAALGAGALLMDQFAVDDNRPPYVKISALRSLKPDILLLAGGIDGGAKNQVLDMAKIIKDSDVEPRFGAEYQLPLIYAGNVEIRDEITGILDEDAYATKTVDNVRPFIDRENLGPAREGIYDAYMEHVIIHSPGYGKLREWTSERIIPTQATIGKIIYAYAQHRGVNLLAVDVGGETTDVYSVYNGLFNRSLNAGVGLTYGISNVVKEAGIANVQRWLPPTMDERTLRNIVGNMLVHQPQSHTKDEELIQAAVAREAIRLGVEQHKEIASRLKGVHIDRNLSDLFNQALEPTYIDMMRTQAVIGKGDVFRAQGYEQSAMILIDSLQPEGFTELYVDDSSVMAQIGSLHGHDQGSAVDLFLNRCIKSLGTVVSPRGKMRDGEEALKLIVTDQTGAEVQHTVRYGEIRVMPLRDDSTMDITVQPLKMDIGAGRGKPATRKVAGGVLGVIFDARGRPLERPNKPLTLIEPTRQPIASPEGQR
ncbi:MAG TPA: glutamate mutase L [Candidatus Bathyarchaeia archaeon]